MWDFSERTEEEVAQQLERYEPLTDSVRQLIDATLRTDAGDDVVASVKADIDSATSRLRSVQHDGPSGISLMPSGATVAWGNVAIGPRNAVAPPLMVQRDTPNSAYIEVDLGVAYEGAPGHLHGGYAALIMDHLFGDVASYGSPASVAATGTITFRYQRPTPLGHVRAEAEIRSTEGRKIIVVGHLADAEGATVTAEGVFIALRR